MTFNSGKEMLDTLNNDVDLYNSETETYVFNYNSLGSICVYHVTNEDAEKLKKEDEYWGSYLGVGGAIYDDTSCSREKGDYTNLDWCNDNYKGEWEDVSP